MNFIKEKYKALTEKAPIIADGLKTFALALLISAVVAGVSFLALWSVGIYDNLETALDLKYDSPLLLAPMWVMLAAFALCVVVGLLMYFHKYKRPKVKSEFGKALAPILGQGTGKEG